MLEKKKLRDIAESISGIRPSERSLEGIVSFIEEKANIVYEKQPRTFLGRLRELGYALNGVRPTQRSLRGIVNTIYEGFNPEPPISDKIYGVENMFSTVHLSRTDDAVGMNYTKNDDGTITSDFDKVFPFNQMKRVEIENDFGDKNVFVKIPAMWFRIGLTQYNQITDIAVSQVKGEGDNWYQTKEFYYGAYKGSVNVQTETDCLVSYSKNEMPIYRYDFSGFRQLAENNGENYQLLDLYHRTIINFLYLIEFANKKTSEVFPMSFDSIQNIGLTDTIKTPTGALANGRFRWRYIEDLFGNTQECIDGVSGNYYASSDPSKYASGELDELSYFNSAYTNIAYYIKDFDWDNDHPFLVMAQTAGAEKYYGEKSVTMSNEDRETYAYTCGKPYTDNTDNYYGLLSFGTISKDGLYDNAISARLLYCPNGV